MIDDYLEEESEEDLIYIDQCPECGEGNLWLDPEEPPPHEFFCDNCGYVRYADPVGVHNELYSDEA